jgi:hypothetical protein
MTPDILHLRICMMLAFLSVVTNGKNAETKDAEKKVVALAKHIYDQWVKTCRTKFCGNLFLPFLHSSS